MAVYVNGIKGNQVLDVQVTQDLNAGALGQAYVVPVGTTVKILGGTIFADAVITQTITIGRGYAMVGYDTTLIEYDMVAEDHFVWYPDGELIITGAGANNITVVCTNAGAPAINVGSTINVEIIR